MTPSDQLTPLDLFYNLTFFITSIYKPFNHL